jgi:DNA-binding Xre family transcriptional regulator
MVFCNLAVLLAARGSNIAKFSRETGLSRTTLNDLAKGYAQGIQFETMNTICMNLGINPSDLFLFTPTEMKIKNMYAEEPDPDLEKDEGIIEFKGFFCIEAINILINSTVFFQYQAAYIADDEFPDLHFLEAGIHADISLQLPSEIEHFEKHAYSRLDIGFRMQLESQVRKLIEANAHELRPMIIPRDVRLHSLSPSLEKAIKTATAGAN